MPIKIESSDADFTSLFLDYITYFDYIASAQLWMVEIPKESVDSLKKMIAENINKYDNNRWEISKDIEGTLSKGQINNTYCFIAQNVTFPGDSIQMQKTGTDKTGFLKGFSGEGRQSLVNINIQFIENNISVADVFFRPWSIIAGYKSMKKPDIKIPQILLHTFKKEGADKPLKIRKTFVLENVVPISVDNEEYNYTGDKLILRSVEFAFSNYYVVSDGRTFRFDSGDFIRKIDEISIDHNIKKEPPLDIEIDDHFIEKEPSSFIAPGDHFIEKEPKGFVAPVEKQFDPPTPIVTSSKTLLDTTADLLRKPQELIAKASGAFNVVTGKVNTIQSFASQTLRGVGLDKEADKFDRDMGRNKENTLGEVGKIVGTGIKYSGAASSGLQTATEIANITSPHAQTRYQAPKISIPADHQPKK